MSAGDQRACAEVVVFHGRDEGRVQTLQLPGRRGQSPQNPVSAFGGTRARQLVLPVEMPPYPDGRRRQLRRGGFSSQQAAKQARDYLRNPFAHVMSPFFLLCSTAISRRGPLLVKGTTEGRSVLPDRPMRTTPPRVFSEKRGEVDRQSRISLGPTPASGCATGSPGVNYRTGRLVGIFATEASDQHGLENGRSLRENHFR